MSSKLEPRALPSVDDPAENANTLFAWLEKQPLGELRELAEALFVQLLDRASRSRSASVNACTKLCGFVQHCAKARPAAQESAERTEAAAVLRDWALEPATATRLFYFFMEWNEKDQHRSMKLVLDLLALLMQPKEREGVQTPQTRQTLQAKEVHAHILKSLVAVLSHRSTRPLVKSAMASLNHLLSKGVYTLDDVARAYGREVGVGGGNEGGDEDSGRGSEMSRGRLALWRQFVRDLFAWMTLHYVCPVAGKLLVSVFTYLRTTAENASRDVSETSATSATLGAETCATQATFSVRLWLEWLRDGLSTNPRILEDVKLYFFIPLFKADRDSSLQLLEILNQTPSQNEPPQAPQAPLAPLVDSGTVLQLAALEVGKKAGLVVDADDQTSLARPSKTASKSSKKSAGRTIALNETVLNDVLGRAPADVRSLALSLLVSSQSTTKPFSQTALALLQKHLPGYHAESDAKFRYELLAHERDMMMRIKGAMAAMERDGRAREDGNDGNDGDDARLPQHRAFLSWYLAFLRNDLAPTASYQRHFTSLRATAAVLRMRRDVSGGVGDALDVGLARRLCHDAAWVRCLLDLLVDPFDDVRETAAALLVQVASAEEEDGDEAEEDMEEGGGGELSLLLSEFSARADILASKTARADHADGAARCQGLLASWAKRMRDKSCGDDGKQSRIRPQLVILDDVLDRLEAKLARAEEDLGAAAVHSPVHGEFASIRYIWDVLAREKHGEAELATLQAVQARIVHSCERVWKAVRHVLCDDSPEGHLPQEMEDVAGLDSKDLLSFSFRSINESSNTMRSIVGHLRFSRVKGTLCPSRDVFAAIGTLSFEQLAALRHRGALSTVTQTFTLCCQLAQDPLITLPGTPEEETLVMGWYRGTIGCIASQVSTTRRSAGIPSLFTGILAAHAPRPTLDEAIGTACEMAQQPAHVRETDGSRLPQVHALNCLRDVFRSSLLSKRAERLLPDCLQLAANMLQSPVWAIRNCGLLLLRSLIDCLFGTGESKASLESGWDGRTIRVSYNKYPTLPGVLLSLLAPETATREGERPGGPQEKSNTPGQPDRPNGPNGGLAQIASQQAAAESVFPALDILRRAGPPETHRDDLYAAVITHLGSHLWHVREMAARTVCSFLVGRDWAAGLARLLGEEEARGEETEQVSTRPIPSANRLHGTLLAIRFVLGRIAEVARGELADALPHLLCLLQDVCRQNSLVLRCPEIEAAYLEALNTISGLALDLNMDLPLDQLPLSSLTAAATPSATPSALLRIQRALQANYAAVRCGDRDAVRQLLDAHVDVDPDTATQLLEAVAQTWPSTSASSSTSSSSSSSTAAWLCGIYADICLRPAAVVPSQLRAAALLHLAETLDECLSAPSSAASSPLAIIDPAILTRVWTAFSGGRAGATDEDDGEAPGYISPTLACALLRASGPIMAVLASTQTHASSSLAAWAAMLSHAGEADQTFDSRLAAAEALRSFTVGGWKSSHASDDQQKPHGLLPLVFCIYDALNDDDDEIREVAAAAAAAVLGSPLVPAEAARRLPAWMAEHFATGAFWAEAVWRMVGKPGGEGGASREATSWPPASSLLASALRFDDALFMIEDQNLYVDEVREAQRWAAVVEASAAMAAHDQQYMAVLSWVVDGLKALVDHMNSSKDGDGPLGWTAAPAVFAVSAHLIISARVLAQISAMPSSAGSFSDASEAAVRLIVSLDTFNLVGKTLDVHGLLLDMATGR